MFAYRLVSSEMIVIGLIVLLLFGSRLQDVARSLGRAVTSPGVPALNESS